MEMGIYPRTLYVVKGENSGKVITDNFKSRDSEELNVGIRDDTDGSETWSVIEKNTNKFGFLVRLKRVSDKSDLAHEATHVAFETFRDIGGIADENNQEPFAYLIGWITRQLYYALNYRDTKRK
jgi:hypothetical protein